MAYSTPPTQTNGDVIGATQWNRLGDNDKFLAADHPFCQAALSTPQSIPDNTSTMVAWDVNTIDNASIHSTSVNPSRFTAPITAWYQMTAWISWAVDADGVRIARWLFNGTGDSVGSDSRLAFGIFGVDAQVSAEIAMTAGQYVQLQVHHAAGGALGIGGAATFRWIKN